MTGAPPGRIPPPQLPPVSGAGGDGRFTGLEKQTQQMSLQSGSVDSPYGPGSSQRMQSVDQQPQRPGAGPSFGGRPQPPRVGDVMPPSSSDGRLGDMSRPPRPLPQPSNPGPPMQQQQQQPPQQQSQQQQGGMYGARPQPPSAYSQQQPPVHSMQQSQSSLNVVPRPQQRRCHLNSSRSLRRVHLPRLRSSSSSRSSSNKSVWCRGAFWRLATSRMLPSSRRKIGLDDFNFLAVLGKGNFGKVMLAEEKRSGHLYAIKVLKKEFIIENDEVESTKSEKRVFLAAARERHPFLLGLHSCFQTTTRVYFVMEYISGGDLMLHIQREPFTPRRAKFYAAEVLLALEYFHKQGIIYRDLKLDNIMLTLDGHIKVADYGLCKEEMWYGNTTSTFCGTPEFMAPEILLEQRYGRAVDWWAFGILIYEMLLGQAPFRGDDEDEIFDAILEDEPLYPLHMPADSVSILEKLLTRDPARRLGSGPTDAEEIKAHPFFRDVNWDDMFNKRVPPPFCPTLKNPSDTSWFDTEFTSEKQR